MLARIAHELFWLGRNVSRAEHTARLIDGVFQADVQGSHDDPSGVTLSWEAVLAIMGSTPAPRDAGEASPGYEQQAGHGRASRDETVALLSTDHQNVNSVVASVERAREGARTVRDVISAEMWEAINGFQLGRPVLLRRLREESLGAVLGTRGADDAARRGLCLPRRGRPLRGCGHGSADAARGTAVDR